MIEAADILLVGTRQGVAVEQRHRDGVPPRLAVDGAGPCCRLAISADREHGPLIHWIIGRLQHLDGGAGPRILPFAQQLAGGRVHVQQQLARDETPAGAALRVVDRHALTDVVALDVEQLAICFTRHAGEALAVEVIDRGRIVDCTTLDFAADQVHAFRGGEVDFFGLGRAERGGAGKADRDSRRQGGQRGE